MDDWQDDKAAMAGSWTYDCVVAAVSSVICLGGAEPQGYPGFSAYGKASISNLEVGT